MLYTLTHRPTSASQTRQRPTSADWTNLHHPKNSQHNSTNFAPWKYSGVLFNPPKKLMFLFTFLKWTLLTKGRGIKGLQVAIIDTFGEGTR